MQTAPEKGAGSCGGTEPDIQVSNQNQITQLVRTVCLSVEVLLLLRVGGDGVGL